MAWCNGRGRCALIRRSRCMTGKEARGRRRILRARRRGESRCEWRSSGSRRRGSLAELDFGGPLAALVLWRFGDGGDVGVAAEVFAQGAAEDAHAGAVDDAAAGESGEEGAVEEALDFVVSLVGGA